MWFELKFYFLWGLVGVFKKLRIITEEDADRHWAILWSLALIDGAREREEYRRSWGL